MIKRVVSSVVGLPILIFVVYVGGIVLQCAIFALAFVGMYELYNAISQKNLYIHYVGYFFTALYALILPYFSGFIATVLFAAFIVTLLICMVILYEKLRLRDVLVTLFGFFYVAFLISFIYLVRSHSYGNFFVWLIFISAWGSDTFAYLIGRKYGKHKLYESLSPKKTVEGAAGGVAGATLIGFIYAVAIKLFNPDVDIDIILYFAIVCFVCSIFSQFGDLAASAIKRYTNIKDFGNLIPGHGGILDRFDSLLFTAPGVYFVMYIILDAMR